jgi:hypothetical protein
MSGQQTSNYGGKQPDNSTYIKQFNSSASGYASWIFKKFNGIPFITTASSKSVLIQKDLVVVGSINNSSDVKLKENIEAITHDDCDEFLKVKAKKYNYKNDENKKLRYGFIAQELELFFPHLVSEMVEDDGTVTKTVNYMDMIPILLCKIQKMQTEIDILKEKIDNKEE